MKKAKTAAPPKPWERQEKESDVAFEAFTIYRDMGQERSVRAVVQKLNKSLTILGKWSSKWNLVERANAWDDELDRVTRAGIVKGVTAMRKKYIDTAEVVLTRALQALKNLSTDDMTAKDIKEFLKLAMEMETSNRLLGTDEEAKSPTPTSSGGLMIAPLGQYYWVH